jgi:tetratricopeptide (TPR) repeat protein
VFIKAVIVFDGPEGHFSSRRLGDFASRAAERNFTGGRAVHYKIPSTTRSHMRLTAVALAFTLAASAAFAQSGNTVQQATAAFEQGRYDDVKRLLAAYVGSPTNADAPYYLGRVAMAQQKFDDAADFFEKAVGMKPNNASYHYWLGSAYGQQAMRANMIKQGMMAGKVRDEYARAVQLDPKNIDARDGLMQFYLMAPGFMGGSDEKAKEQAAAILKLDAARGHFAMIQIYSKDKRADLIEKEFADWIKAEPTSAKPHVSKAAYHTSNTKNFKLAQDELDAAVRIDPTYGPAQFRIAQLAVLSNTNLPKGEEAARKYVAYKPKEGEPSPARAHYWLGRVLEAQGKKDQARKEYQESLRLVPETKDVTEALKRVS